MARQILAEIVKDMFLRDCDQQNHLQQMKRRAHSLAETLQQQHEVIQTCSATLTVHQTACQEDVRLTQMSSVLNLMHEFGRRLAQNWQDNQLLDAGCNPPAIKQLADLVHELCLGYKLPGAGGGGFLYMVARSPEAAQEIRHRLAANPLSPTARFYEMSLSQEGFRVASIN